MRNDELEAILLELEQYKRLWELLEDLETLLWNIKVLNDERQAMTEQR